CGQLRLEPGQLAARHLAQVGVGVVEQLAMTVDLARDLLAAPVDRDRLLELRALPCELRELAVVGDDGRIGDQTLELLATPLDLLQPLQHPTPEPPPVRWA